MSMNVGFIGLGIMGTPMALNLVRGGFPLWVYDHRPETAAPLAIAGARACGSAEEVARSADIIFIMVSDTEAAEQAIVGPEGVLAGARSGAAVVIMSTASPETVRSFAARLGEKAAEMLDAPVSGGEQEAAAGTLTIMAGGKPELFDRLRPLFERLGKNIVHVGPLGAGQLAKACNQILVTMAVEGVAEAFTFARKNGVDPHRVREALLGGFAGSRALEVQGKRMLERDFQPGFRADLHHKEMRIVMETAFEAGIALPGAALATQLMGALAGSGDGKLDSAALVSVIERMNESHIMTAGQGPSLPRREGKEEKGDTARMARNVGFIGLGVMGRPMAMNLIKGGCRLRVYGRRKETMAPLVEAGAIACASPEEAAWDCDVIFTMVTNTEDVLEVDLGERGVIAGARPGSIVVDMGTISPAATRTIAARLEEAGLESLDAPVSGGGTGAINGTLSIMVGGKPEIFERVKPLFSCLGKIIVHIGPNGAGQVAKACNQVVMLTTLQGLAEAFAFARRSGLDPQKVYESLAGGAAECRILEVLGKRMVERNYAPGIEARLHYKDIQIVLNEAHTLGMALPGTALVTQMFNALIGRGGGNQDSSRLIEVLEAISNPRQPSSATRERPASTRG